MNLSYWEQKTWFKNIDYAILGSGIVGLTCALELRKNHPHSKIVILERGKLPSGASTKNAGFACFGSLSEIIDDLKSHTPEEVVNLVKQRVEGLQILRENLEDTNIDFEPNGGYELFIEQDEEPYNSCLNQMAYVNKLLQPIFNAPVFSVKPNSFHFGNIKKSLIFNQFEAQIDTGKMMKVLLKKTIEQDILILNNTKVEGVKQLENGVKIELENQDIIKSKNVCIAINGFAKQFLNKDIQPARAQVLITEPIENLQIKGTFHLDRGYYYFRNIDNRILLGGGRNLDIEGETTTKMEVTQQIQDRLKHILKTIILPNTPHTIDCSWSGIMGVGRQKNPIVEVVSKNIYCGVRLGGMEVAIGSNIGKNLAILATEHISE